jgi:ligand-binding sensor domain-containing protein
MKGVLAGLFILMFCAFKGQSQVSKDSAEYDPYNDIISSVLMDRAGNLWFAATGRGVYRYDSRSFINLTIKDGLSGNNVSCIYEDKAGTLWFATGGGVCKYDGKTFSKFPIPSPDSSSESKYLKKESSVCSILQDKKGNYWFLTLHNGVFRYDGKKFSNFLAHEVLVCLIEDKEGKIWVGSWQHGGIYRFNGEDFVHIDGTSDDMVFCFFNDNKGDLWIGTRNRGVDKFDGKKFINYSDKDGLCNNNLSCIFQDRSGTMWFGSDINWSTERGDACRFDGKRFENITSNASLTTKGGRLYSVKTIVQDSLGNLWFGSRGGLLLRYDGSEFMDFSENVALKN